jgi:hypothetical protein
MSKSCKESVHFSQAVHIASGIATALKMAGRTFKVDEAFWILFLSMGGIGRRDQFGLAIHKSRF